MKICLTLALLFSIECYSQAKNEISFSYGYHTRIYGSYERSLYGIIIEDASGIKNGVKNYDPSLHFRLNYFRVFRDYLKAGSGVEYNFINGCQNISPFISGKVFMPAKPVHPYLIGSVGINFMKFDSKRFFTGLFYEIGTGLNIDMTKKMYVDLGVNYTYLDSRESTKEGKITSNSVIQRFKNVNLIMGLIYCIK